MQKKTFRIFFGNNANIQEIEKHLNRGNDERITDNNSNGAVRQKLVTAIIIIVSRVSIPLRMPTVV